MAGKQTLEQAIQQAVDIAKKNMDEQLRRAQSAKDAARRKAQDEQIKANLDKLAGKTPS